MTSTDRVEIRGASIAYQRTGGTGPVLIWGHGLSQSMETEHVLGLLDWSAIETPVLRYDARGHGTSTTTEDLRDYGWDRLALDQLALADELGIANYVVGGASMGCGTALHAVATAPDRIDRCILAIPPTAWETRRAQSDEWERIAQVIETAGVEPVIAAREEQPLPDPLRGDPDIRHRQAEATRAWEPARLAHAMRGATHADLPSREVIAGIQAPCLILAWTGDPVHPEVTARVLHDLLPNSTLEIASTADDMAGWTGLVRDFLIN